VAGLPAVVPMTSLTGTAAELVRSRRAYREMLVTTPYLAEGVSGVILCEETFRQRLGDGQTFPTALVSRGLLPGIKVDLGARPLAGAPGEKVTEGLDGLCERLAQYAGLGARFAKWRAVFPVGSSPITELPWTASC
jgi:fructose-bisphosphate aldolase, class I